MKYVHGMPLKWSVPRVFVHYSDFRVEKDFCPTFVCWAKVGRGVQTVSTQPNSTENNGKSCMDVGQKFDLTQT